MKTRTIVLTTLLIAIASAPHAVAEPLAPAVVGEVTPGGHLIQWEAPPGSSPEQWMVEVWHDGILEHNATLAGDTDSFTYEDPAEGVFQYVVRYEQDGATSSPGTTTLPGYPWCLDVVVLSTSWPFVKVHEECLLPPPI